MKGKTLGYWGGKPGRDTGPPPAPPRSTLTVGSPGCPPHTHHSEIISSRRIRWFPLGCATGGVRLSYEARFANFSESGGKVYLDILGGKTTSYPMMKTLLGKFRKELFRKLAPGQKREADLLLADALARAKREYPWMFGEIVPLPNTGEQRTLTLQEQVLLDKALARSTRIISSGYAPDAGEGFTRHPAYTAGWLAAVRALRGLTPTPRSISDAAYLLEVMLDSPNSK